MKMASATEENDSETERELAGNDKDVNSSDCCFGVVLVVSAFLVYVPVAGFANSFGVFVEMFDRDFCQPDDCLELLGLVSALAIANFRVLCWLQVLLEQYIAVPILFFLGTVLCFLSMLLTSYVQDVYTLLLTHSLLYGFGSTFMLNAPVSAIGQHFPEGHRFHVLASGIINLGPSVGVVVMNPLSVYLDSTEKYSWRDTLKVFSVAILVVAVIHFAVLVSAHYRKRKRDTYEQLVEDDDNGATSGGSAICRPANWASFGTFAWLFGIFSVGASLFIPKTLFMKYLVGLNFSDSDSALLLSYGGISETIFSLIVSLVGDMMGAHLLLVYAVSSAFLTLSNVVIPYFKGQVALGIYCIFNGACDGLLMTVLFGVVTQVSPTKQGHATLWCLTNLVVGTGQIVGLPIAGLIYDHTKSYNPIFIMSAATFGISVLFFTASYVQILLRKRSKNKANDNLSGNVNPLPITAE